MSARRLAAAATIAVVLAAPVGAADQATAQESRTRRFENVFFIALPFTAMYSSLLTLGGTLLIHKGAFAVTPATQAVGAGLTVLGAGWIAWHDLKSASRQARFDKVNGVRATATTPDGPARPAVTEGQPLRRGGPGERLTSDGSALECRGSSAG